MRLNRANRWALIVEDDRDLVDEVRTILDGELDGNVAVATTGADAVSFLRRVSRRPCAVIVDHHTRGLDVVALVASLREGDLLLTMPVTVRVGGTRTAMDLNVLWDTARLYRDHGVKGVDAYAADQRESLRELRHLRERAEAYGLRPSPP